MREIVDYLIENRDFLMSLLKDDITNRDDLLKREPFFKEEIEEQFRLLARHKIADYITRLFACDYETIVILLEKKEYFE